MTRAGDVWCCEECGKEQGRHDQFFDGICEDCHNEKEESKHLDEVRKKRDELISKRNYLLKVEFQKRLKLKMRKGK